jgi:hypothetical protein
MDDVKEAETLVKEVKAAAKKAVCRIGNFIYSDGTEVQFTSDMLSQVAQNSSNGEWLDGHGGKNIGTFQKVEFDGVCLWCESENLPEVDAKKQPSIEITCENGRPVLTGVAWVDQPLVTNLGTWRIAASIDGKHVFSVQEVLASKDAQIKALEDQLKEKQVVVEAKPVETISVSSYLVKIASDARSRKLEAAVVARNITPFVRKQLTELFVGKDNQVIQASLNDEKRYATEEELMDKILTILAANKAAVPTGEVLTRTEHDDSLLGTIKRMK